MTGIDTNILIYACDLSDPVRQAKAFDLLASTRDGFVLWQVACEFIAASRKLASQGFSQVHAWNRLGEYLTLFPLVLPTRGILTRARSLHIEQGLSFWDAVIVGGCIEAGADRLYSEDLPGRRISSLDIINPLR